MSMRCYFGFHKWGKWGEQIYLQTTPLTEKHMFGVKLERTCTRCPSYERWEYGPYDILERKELVRTKNENLDAGMRLIKGRKP